MVAMPTVGTMPSGANSGSGEMTRGAIGSGKRAFITCWITPSRSSMRLRRVLRTHVATAEAEAGVLVLVLVLVRVRVRVLVVVRVKGLASSGDGECRGFQPTTYAGYAMVVAPAG